MKVILFGASGMVGQGALRECLLDPEVSEVLAVVRRPLEPQRDPAVAALAATKLRELTHADLGRLDPIADRLAGYDACFFCLGTSSAGMKEAAYRAVTYDLTLGVATTLARVSPAMTFLYVSGAGTDSSERGRSMWARVKGETENALLRLPFKAAYMLRPGIIQPKHGIKSRTRWMRIMYVAATPLYPVMRFCARRFITDTEELGRAMLLLVKHGSDKRVLEQRDLTALARGETAHAA